MRYIDVKLFLFTFLFHIHVFSQNVLINEVMSSNNSILPDNNGEYYDWIELYNTSNSSLNLNGYYLSDDTSNIFKWKFPDVIINPDSFLVAIASGSDESQIIRHWETVIDWGDNWHYHSGSSGAPPVNWNSIDFDDSSWPEGPSGFGYGDSDDATVVAQTLSLYIRRKFTIDDITNISATLLHIDYDDAFVAFLNGKEITRANIGIKGIEPGYDQPASSAREATIYSGGLPEKFVISGFDSILVEGENVLCIQVHNIDITSSDMSAIPFLTFGMKHTPENAKGSSEILNLGIPNLQTNFKIDADGEYLVLSDTSGNEIDKIFTGAIPSGISKGRYPDGAEEWYYFNDPTPGFTNSDNHYSVIEEPPLFSKPGGFYQSQVSLTLSNNGSSGNIFYTLDGSEPTSSSHQYSSPIDISSTSVVRARVIGQNSIPSEIITCTYIMNENIRLPVISISTNPENLWDEETGIYVLGNNAESEYPYFGANFWQDWEKPIHIEFFESNGDSAFSMDAGTKIYGGWSRGHAQKSLAIYARSSYGKGEISYKVFPELPIEEFESIVLRNSGNDWDYSFIRDALMSRISSEVNVEAQAYRPAVVFLNGDYWGIHNVREKINEHFIASHFDIDPEGINLLENQSSVIQGDNSDYIALLDFLQNNNLNSTSNYEFVKNKIDIDNFINYMLCEIYYDNEDWPGNNIKFWSSTAEGSKWRWIQFDTDFGFGLYNHSSYKNNTLAFATATNGPDWPNPPWSTLLIRKLLGNNEFKNEFISRYADLSNSLFKPDNIINKIGNIVNQITPEIQRHLSRWGLSYNKWLNEVQSLYDFANNRTPYLQSFFLSKFNINGMTTIEVNTNTNRGTVLVNSLTINEAQWRGSYFKGIPITISALPLTGYTFSHWEGYSSNERVITVLPENISSITANFEPKTSFNGNVVINEINYNSSKNFDSEDWIEIYNDSSSVVDLSGWVFKDEDNDHNFVIPDGTTLPVNAYLVLCKDSVLFKNIYPDCKNFIGDFGFGLDNGGELLRLYNNNLILVDSVDYDDEYPWATEPDGNGSTLSLVNPDLDNYDPKNWKASSLLGTPGKANDVYVNVEKGKGNLPTEFRLDQNYPNPFNPLTTMQYLIPQVSHVTIKVYDIIGKEIKTLVNEEKLAGKYVVQFDGSNFSSGVYFYQMRAGEFIDTKKFILLK